MASLLRPAITFVVFVATYFFVFWLPCSVLSLHDVPALAQLVSLGCAAAAAQFAWQKTGAEPDGLFATVGYGAALLGAIGFVIGFFGPMIFAPDANQGPLLGIFVTGPGGVVVGAVGGFFRWQHRNAGAAR